MSDFTYELIKENKYLPAFFRTVKDFSITVPAHWHQYLEIIYLTAGKMTAVIQGQTYELTARDMLIINSEDIHMTQVSDEETCYYLLQVSASQLSNFFPNFQLLRFDTIISPVSSSDSFTTNSFKEFPLSKAEHCMIEMHSIFQKKADGYPLLFSAKLHELLYELYKNHSAWLPARKYDRNFQQILEILNWVQNHYMEPLTLTQAASYLGFSREYFCRLFKKFTGQTFLEYVNNIRAMKLYDDLNTSTESITSLMEKHGITNYKVFLRTFRELYGTTPQKIRRKS